MVSKKVPATHSALCLLLFALLLLCACGGFAARSIVISRLVKKAPNGPAYIYVPFEVPSGTRSISVSLEYDKKDGKNRLELGVFDERFSGTHYDKSGFRGWSGSVRDGFFITEEKATFGYQKGKVNPGKWYLIVGLAALEKDGVTAKFNIDFDFIPQPLEVQWVQESSKEFRHKTIKPGREGSWIKGDLHTHTFHSDGKWSVKGILDSAKSRGLDFVAITDHNTFSHHAEIDTFAKEYPQLLVLKGEEVTTYAGHINIWGLDTGDWIDFRAERANPEIAARMVNKAHGFGALASLNHPTMGCAGCDWGYGDWTQMDSVEIWNAKWDDEDEQALQLWDKLLKEGKRITAIGSSDTHLPPYEPSEYPVNRAVGSPAVFVRSGRDKANLLESIKAGHVYVTEDPQQEVTFSAFQGSETGDSIVANDSGEVNFFVRLKGFRKGSWLKVISHLADERKSTVSKQVSEPILELNSSIRVDGPGYIRLEVRNPDGSMAAFTNPIWIKAIDN